MHPQVTKNSTEQTSSTSTTDDVNQLTTDEISTADICMDNEIREVQSTSSTQQSNNEMPNLYVCIQLTRHVRTRLLKLA